MWRVNQNGVNFWEIIWWGDLGQVSLSKWECPKSPIVIMLRNNNARPKSPMRLSQVSRHCPKSPPKGCHDNGVYISEVNM